ncbi:MAG: UvrD-helicase domain-containing protein, partial [Anaerolineales bacterium]
VAGDAMAAYQEFKTKRGLIDFVDQEQLMLKALDRPEIFGVIEDELDLLLVDEFQDTSPIQLALFLKLSEAADQAVFVGDVKQAIYGFRGSDPELMQAVLKKVETDGGKKEILGRSYRSRPHLVEYVNEIFTQAFGDTIPEDQIRLTPARSDPEDMRDDTAVEKWVLKGRSIPVRARELGQGVLELVNSGRRVTDPTTKQPRSVRFSDIAVFARSHPHIAPLAEAFASLGIPVDLERPGLLSTPEACLTLACLRRLADPSDTLASAEIVALSSGEEPETWLIDRLKYLSDGGDSYRWGEDGTYPLLQRLGVSRDRLQFLTPAEAVVYAIEIADLRRLVTAWGSDGWRCALRRNNLDGLVDLARQYEDLCRNQRQAATLGGLLLWLENLKQKKLDVQPKNLGGDAVTLSTHHGAKGQEWPVVIATDLADNIWRRLWDLNAVSGSDSIDLENPLAGRRLRYWPWPFGSQKAGIAVADRVETSSWGRASLLRDTEEEKRLLYVSLSRARDLLILPFYSKKPKGPWIDSLTADWMVPMGDRLQLSEQLEIPTAVREYEAAEDDVAAATYEPFWFDERASVTEKLAKKVSPSELPGIETSSIAALETISTGISVKGHPDMSILGDVLHVAISLQISDPKQPAYLALVRCILEEKGLDASVEINEIVQEVKEFIKFINAKFNPQKVWAEYPMIHVWETGQVAKGWIDVLLETEAGLIIIDHKTTRDDPKPVVAKYSGQLLAYEQAVEAATGKTAESWIHFPLSGNMAKLAY